jgi:pumilio RNA-binding family
MKIEDYSLRLQIILIVTLKSTRVMFTVELDGWQGDCIHMKLHTQILIVYRYNLSPLYLLLCFHFFSFYSHPQLFQWQENISRTAATAGHLSRSNSRNALEGPTPIRSSDSPKPQLQHRSESMNGLRSGSTSPSLVRVQSLGSSMSHTFASAVGSSISRSTTPDPQLIRRTPSPCLPPVGVRMGSSDKKVEAAAVASLNHDNADIAATLSSLNLSGNKMSNVENQAQNHVYQNFGDQTDVLFNVPKEHRQFSPQILSQNTDDGSFNAHEYVVFPNGGSNFSSASFAYCCARSVEALGFRRPLFLKERNWLVR